MDYLVVGDNFSKFLLLRKISNTSSTHSVIKGLGMVFTEFGCPFVLIIDNGSCYTSREFHNFPEFYQVHHIRCSPNHPQSNGFAEPLVGISKKLMEKSIKDGKPWNYGLLQYRVTPISGNFSSPLEALTGRKLRTSLPQIPSSTGKTVGTPRIRNELNRQQPSTSTHSPMKLKPGQPVFIKKVHENVQKTGIIDQPAKEPGSYWVKFPDNSILRRIQSMIKPQSKPSYFELKAEGKDRNSNGHIPAKSQHPFNSNLQTLEIPALPMASPVLPSLTSKATLTEQGLIPTSSTSASTTSSSSKDNDPVVPTTPRWSTHITKGIPPVRFTPSKK